MSPSTYRRIILQPVRSRGKEKPQNMLAVYLFHFKILILLRSSKSKTNVDMFGIVPYRATQFDSELSLKPPVRRDILFGLVVLIGKSSAPLVAPSTEISVLRTLKDSRDIAFLRID